MAYIPIITLLIRFLNLREVDIVKFLMKPCLNFQSIETRVFSPTTFTVGEERPRIQEKRSSKRKSSESKLASQGQGQAGGSKRQKRMADNGAGAGN